MSEPTAFHEDTQFARLYGVRGMDLHWWGDSQCVEHKCERVVLVEAYDAVVTRLREAEARATKAENERDDLRNYIARLPADWFKDSSLKTWFPITAMMLEDAEARAQRMEADARRLDWIEKHWFILPSDIPNTVEFCFTGLWVVPGKNLRDAIDIAARPVEPREGG